MTIITKSEKETADLGVKIASGLSGGEVLGLEGDLGAGKTVFCRSLIEAFGVKKNVNSPTFVVMKVYTVENHGDVKQICHIDAYRLNSGRELLDIGAGDYFGRPDTIVLIEWAEKVKDVLPDNTIPIKFRHLEGDSREITAKLQ